MMMKNDPIAEKIRKVLSHYQLGELVDYTQNQRGYINLGFAIRIQKNEKVTPYFLRQYKLGIVEDELLFEHSLINHVYEIGKPQVARVYSTQEGKTYVMEDSLADTSQPAFYAIFDFLPGEDKYTWVNPHCTPCETQQSAQVLAEYHQAVWDFRPLGFRREPRIADLLKPIKDNLHACLSQTRLHVPNEIIRPYQSFLDQKIEELIEFFQSLEAQALPELVIHCDYHPGNLKFQDERVVGLFDFDWAKKDYRIFDVALAIFYFFAEWEGTQDGELRIDEASNFISSYQQVMQSSNVVPPLSGDELAQLGRFIESANLYVLNWSIDDLLHKEVHVEEYVPFLLHGIRTAIWLNNPTHQQKIAQLALLNSQIS